jgi:hypothetical protein
MAIAEDIAFALQQQGSFYKSHQWTLRVESFQKAHEETKEFPEEIRGKEILNRFYSLFQEPLAALVEEAVRILAGIVSKLPGSSIRERTRLVEQHVKNSIINPNIRKGPVERWLMEASGWRMDTDVLVGVYEEKLESSWIAPAWLTPPHSLRRQKNVGGNGFLRLATSMCR